MASGAALLDQNSKFCYEMSYAVVSCHEPTACDVSLLQTIQKPFGKMNTTFGHLGRAQVPVSAPNGQYFAIRRVFSAATLHAIGS
jgi:hypothetical protein